MSPPWRHLVVIGASLGGLDALRRVLGPLPEDLPAPILVAQHRRPDDRPGLASVLGRHTSLPVSEAEDRQPIRPGCVILAPPDYHLLVDGDRIALSLDGAVHFSRPSIDVLFQSAVERSPKRVVGVLLTAASEDGAAGLRLVAQRGGYGIVQDPEEAESAVALRAALKLHPGHQVLPVAKIPGRIEELVRRGRRPGRPGGGP